PVPALLGTALAPLTWSLGRALGRPGAAAAALFAAVSPSCVYYSRDAIHEMVLVFLTLLLVVALARAIRSERLVDDLLVGGAAGAIIATKETFPLAIGSVLAGMILSGTEARTRLRPKRIAIAMAAALFVAGAVYSHGFTESAGLLSPVQALRIWGARAEAGEGHRKPGWYFRMALGREGAPIGAGASGR